jgi:glycosyltransferase involved in cell wall biosynthesis
MPPPTTGIGSWTQRVLDCGIDGWQIGFINSNMIGGRDPFKNTKVNIRDEIVRSVSIWKQEIQEIKKDPNYIIVHTNIPCTVNGMIRESVTGIIAKRYGKKHIVHCHCTLPNVENTKIKKNIFRVFSHFVDGFIVLNKNSENFVKEYTNKKVTIIPNFVCKNELPTNLDRTINKTVKNVLFVGGVSPDKGCDTILQAALKIPDVTFHLVGIVSEEIRNMKKPENVILYGNKSKEFVKEIMLKCDLFLFLSRFYGEGFSVALVEAMSTGLPCIVTDWAANADMVSPDGGIVIPQKSPDKLVNTIEYYNENQPLRERASKFNINKVENYYIDKVALEMISSFYEEVINEIKDIYTPGEIS